jgi:hypothetical protein
MDGVYEIFFFEKSHYGVARNLLVRAIALVWKIMYLSRWISGDM